jgi:predicted aconitase with swiveling domain
MNRPDLEPPPGPAHEAAPSTPPAALADNAAAALESGRGAAATRIGQAYARGEATADALVLTEPLSFWGGIDVDSGRIIDHHHPDLGKTVTGRILVMSSGRGSSSSSAVLAETLRRGTGPAGIVIALPDPILTVGALVAQSLYDVFCPIIVCPIDGLQTGDRLHLSAADTGPAEVTRR